MAPYLSMKVRAIKRGHIHGVYRDPLFAGTDKDYLLEFEVTEQQFSKNWMVRLEDYTGPLEEKPLGSLEIPDLLEKEREEKEKKLKEATVKAKIKKSTKPRTVTKTVKKKAK